jgi:hypothetical protein
MIVGFYLELQMVENCVLVGSDRLIDHHFRHGITVFFLLRRVDAVRLRINGKTVHRMLHLEVFDLPVVVGVILVKNRNGSAVAGGVDSSQAWIKFDDIRPSAIGRKAIGSCLSRSKTVMRLFPSHERKAR